MQIRIKDSSECLDAAAKVEVAGANNGNRALSRYE